MKTLSRSGVHRRAQKAHPKSTLTKCERCGTTTAKLQRHHLDYSLPTDVEILCQTCHVIADQEAGTRRKKRPTVCKVCGKTFMANHSKKHNTCSAKCLAQLGLANAMKRWYGHARKRNCVNCGTEFEPPRNRMVTCSASCGNTLAWKRRKLSSRQKLRDLDASATHASHK